MNGWGVAQSAAQAKVWYQKAAEAGNMTAMFNLGTLCYNNKDGASRQEDGLEWYLKAMRSGAYYEWYRDAGASNAAAAFVEGYMYATGTDLPRDAESALDWFNRAFSNPNASAGLLAKMRQQIQTLIANGYLTDAQVRAAVANY